jgi:hypothetical protein
MDKLIVKLAFPGKDGQSIPVELPIDGIGKLVSDLLKVAASMPQKPSLTTDFINDPDPVAATAFGVTRIENQTRSARLSIAVGDLHLQVSVSLSDLFQALEALKRTSEPDPTSSRRPH